MIKLTFADVSRKDFITGLDALAGVTSIKSSRLLIDLARAVKAVREKIEECHKAQLKIYEDLGAKAGEPVPKERLPELAERLGELMSIEFELSFDPIKFKDLPSDKFTPGQVASIDKLLNLN